MYKSFFAIVYNVEHKWGVHYFSQGVSGHHGLEVHRWQERLAGYI